MTPEQTIALNLVKRFPWSTALSLWTQLLQATENPFDMKVIKAGFPEQDQSLRQELARLENTGAIKSRIMAGSILREWALS